MTTEEKAEIIARAKATLEFRDQILYNRDEISTWRKDAVEKMFDHIQDLVAAIEGEGT
jgi:hypothetical protein